MADVDDLTLNTLGGWFGYLVLVGWDRFITRRRSFDSEASMAGGRLP